MIEYARRELLCHRPRTAAHIANRGNVLTDELISGFPLGDSLAVANNGYSAWNVKEGHFLEAKDTISVALDRSSAQSQRLIVAARLSLADAEYPIAETISCIDVRAWMKAPQGSGDRSSVASDNSEAVRGEGFIWIVV